MADAPREEGLDEAQEPAGEPTPAEDGGATAEGGSAEGSPEGSSARGEAVEAAGAADGEASEGSPGAGDEEETDAAAEGEAASPGYEAAFAELESRVRSAAAELAKLRHAKRTAARETKALRERVSELEARLEEKPAASGRADDAPSVSSVRAAWNEEREEVRRRLSGLAERLEDLLSGEEAEEE